MKIKKKTSLMMVAASTAAIVGIAAVSFAAWTGNTLSPVSASAETGTVNTFGFASNNKLTLNGASVKDGADTNKLVPYNQPEAQVNEGAYMVSAALPAYTVYSEGYQVTVSATSDATGTDTTYKLYAKLVESTQTVTAPTTETGLTGWTELDNTDKIMLDENDNTGVAGKNLTLYVVLDSQGAAPTSAVTFDFSVKLISASDPAYQTPVTP